MVDPGRGLDLGPVAGRRGDRTGIGSRCAIACGTHPGPRRALAHRGDPLLGIPHPAPALRPAGGGPGLPRSRPSGAPTLGYIATLTLLDVLVVVGLVATFLHARDETVRELLLGARPPRREAALRGADYAAIVVGAVGGLLLIGWLRRDCATCPTIRSGPCSTRPGRALVFALVVVLAGGLREELQRAFILRRFDQHLGGGCSASSCSASPSVWATRSGLGYGHRHGGTRRALGRAVLDTRQRRRGDGEPHRLQSHPDCAGCLRSAVVTPTATGRPRMISARRSRPVIQSSVSSARPPSRSAT